MKDFKDNQLSHFAIFVDNLPRDKDISSLQQQIENVMLRVFPADQTGKSPFLKVKVIRNYNSLYAKCVALKKSIDALEMVRKSNEDTGVN